MSDHAKTVNDIRSEFLGFFEKRGHEVVASSPLVPQNDPTVMFTMAGMMQFKNDFTGIEKRDYTRAVSSQKCLRAGGKHNDLENVGYTARHHTFFEMLGNFSFGDYFKDDAIAFAWELVTKNFALPADKLLVTVHSTDEEAAAIWKKVTGFSDEKIIRIPTDDNFWRMGDTGPCGPCTEIFYDHGEHIWGGPPGSPEEDGDRFIEIWNNVFMQYEQIDAQTRIDLPAQSVDTGMGLERITATLMGSNNNYDIDIMRDLIEHSADLTGVGADDEKMAASHKVIADHVRASAFLIADGVLPSNEGRGYVLRRIMRRGMRHAHLLGADEPLLHRLLPTLLGSMAEAYPELIRAEKLVSETLRLEEERFKQTLENGLKLLDDAVEKVNDNILPGEVAFKLYDTFGFPLDLTQDALKAQGISVDTDGFEAAMAEQKAKARAAWAGSGAVADEKIWFDLADEYGATDFLGYEMEEAEAQIVAMLLDGVIVGALGAGQTGFVVTNQTPFYAESGGQVGDTGTIETVGGKAKVLDTKKFVGKIWGHYVEVVEGSISAATAAKLIVDQTRRSAIRANHSVTHLLHEALRRTLGEHVTQKGSLQDEKRTRFDISHPKGLSDEELHAVEMRVVEEVAANTPVETRIMDIDAARESGAMALFGEKYNDEVRVVAMGTQDNDRPFSIELCGGTHVKETGDIGAFKIISDSALSSGVRRIEALTGPRVTAYEAEKNAAAKAEFDRVYEIYESLLAQAGDEMIDLPEDLVEARALLEKENKRLEKQIAQARRNAAVSGSEDEIKELGDFKFAGKVLAEFPPKDLKPMADDLKKQIGSGVVVLVATNEGKASIVVGVTDDLTDRLSAVDLVRLGSEALGGKGGGGRPDMAQAGGPDGSAANDALGAIESELA